MTLQVVTVIFIISVIIEVKIMNKTVEANTKTLEVATKVRLTNFKKVVIPFFLDCNRGCD